MNTYVEAIRQLPAKDVHLETKDATYYFFKADALKREITYSTERNAPVNTVTLTAAQAFEVIALNKNGVKPDTLKPEDNGNKDASPFGDLLNQDAINRFDKKKKKKKKKSGNASKGAKPEPSSNEAESKDDGNNSPERRQSRQGKPKRPQQDGKPQQPVDGQQPRREKPQRMEKKTFRPRRPNDSNVSDNGHGQGKPKNE